MKPNFILDLDQTLISAESLDEYDKNKNREKAKKFKSVEMENYYIIFERPGLQEFLDYLFKNFNVSVWTAGSKDYALYIVDSIIMKPTTGSKSSNSSNNSSSGGSGGSKNSEPSRKLDYIFYSYHCKVSKKMKKGTKDLSMLWDVYKLPGYTKENTYILDDYDEVYKKQKHNAIVAPAFEFTHKKSVDDDFFKKLIPQLDLLKEGKITVEQINEKTMENS